MHFNDQLRERTMEMAACIHNLLKGKKSTMTDRNVFDQLFRCSTSVAANYRAATCGRSDAEYFAKICIVLEECDETNFWLNYMVKIKILDTDEASFVIAESKELTKIFSVIKIKMKEKLNKQK